MQTTEQRTHDRKRWDRVDLDQKTHKEDRSFEVGELRNQTSVDQESHTKKKKKPIFASGFQANTSSAISKQVQKLTHNQKPKVLYTNEH